ncbi:MAG: hypothetical protein LBB72_07360, partial [Spirochaetaceae bacterium]|nr:hypothetical protein [Spirochaetaceae bacterium]
MKNKLKLFGIAAFVAVIGFGLIGCSSDGGNDDDKSKPLFSVSGEFKGAGSGNALFKAATAETVSRSAISGDASYELTGELEDGDMLFRLKGT